MPTTDKILILDFGSQYTQLIARRVRESKVYSEILPYHTPLKEIEAHAPSGIILSGGPASVYDAKAPLCDPDLFKLGIPVLGICYGMQLMTHLLGGKVARAAKREFGRADLIVDRPSLLLKGLSNPTPVWMSHGDRIEKAPSGFEPIARTTNSPAAAMENGPRRLYALQFHPEVAHTPQGIQILRNFLYEICGCKPTWDIGSFIKEAERSIAEQIGDGRAVSALSGGVDSSVAAVLVQRVIGKRLTCIFVDNGLLRKDEAKKVVRTFKENLKLNLKPIDASDRFLRKLSSTTDPEKKRKIIGKEFIAIFDEEAKKIGKVDFLIQGTLYPDVIESVSVKGPSATIKTHHNVGGLPKRMRMKLVEPIRTLFKDEVRKLGVELGIPEPLLYRHPFPGPGLAVRVIGKITRERLDRLREADAILEEEIREAG
ncbi:MAG TPA: glutamine-hydrolyzing GMP synthase, partial [Candidatus Manganitrophaceae bacterium]|nr:glutamine-hydrolyzing GMP synthase [Candidatus Manganitrophaceae bacterium]